MRVVTVIAVLLVGGAATLEAQHQFQFEVGGFAAYTRFDRAFLFDNQIGGGGRIGFWITNWLGIEGDGLYQRPRSTTGGANFPVWFASGSLVLNFGSEKSFYILGGYSAMDFNSTAAGGFRDVGAHGAIGDRIFITDRVALRLEAGAYYAPKTQAPAGNQWAGQLVGSAGLSFFLGPSHRESPYPEVPKEKRDSILAAGGKVPEARPRGGPTYEQRSSDWQHKWYWGGEAGIMEALNVQVSCASCTGSDLGQLQDEADRAATKAFFWWMGGVDIKQGRLALYGQYILTSAAANFLIQGTTHTFQGGVRYSLGSSKEGVTDRQ